MVKKNASISSCPGCGKTGRSDNVKRHMLTCKKLKAREFAVTTPAAFKAALDTKDAQIVEAERRIAQLEALSKTTHITVNNTTINNYLTINVVPLLDSNGDFLDDETIPERSVVRERLKRKRASEAVPTYLQLKHFKTGPEFGNMRIRGAPKKLEVIQRGADGTCTWVGAPKGTLTNLVSYAFDDLDNHYDVASIPELKWQEWKDEGKLDEEDIRELPAFKQTLRDVRDMIDKSHSSSHLPRESKPEEEGEADDDQEYDDDEEDVPTSKILFDSDSPQGNLQKGAFFIMYDGLVYHCVIMDVDGTKLKVLMVKRRGPLKNVWIDKKQFAADNGSTRHWRYKLFDPKEGFKVEVVGNPCTIKKYEVREEQGSLTLMAHVVDSRQKTEWLDCTDPRLELNIGPETFK